MSAQVIDYIAAGMGATGVALFCQGFLTWRNRRLLARRLETQVGADALAQVRASRQEERERWASIALATDLARRLRQSSLGAFVQTRLTRAGLAMQPARFIQLQGMAAVVAALVGWTLFRSGGSMAQLLVATVVGALGFATPLIVLNHLEKRRLAAFERQLPQVIDSMAGTLQAGSSLPQAMEITAREMPPPISVEFSRVLREMELGLSLTDSLSNMQDRVRSADLVLMNSAIAIQQRVGGDLAGIFRAISHTVRERLRIRGDIQVLTAQGRYSTYIITALPILLFLWLWATNRPYISQLFLPGITQVMFGVGIVGIALGYFAMKKIVSIEV